MTVPVASVRVSLGEEDRGTDRLERDGSYGFRLSEILRERGMAEIDERELGHLAFSSLLSKPIFLCTPSSSGSVCTDCSSKASYFMEQMVSEKQITLRSSSTGPGGPGFGSNLCGSWLFISTLLHPQPLEDDVVLIVGHFHDSSEQRIRFPSSDDCVFAKENSGRVEDPGERFARRVLLFFILNFLLKNCFELMVVKFSHT
ncbi:hypothetical protein ACFX2C_040783 [Malus domestica]